MLEMQKSHVLKAGNFHDKWIKVFLSTLKMKSFKPDNHHLRAVWVRKKNTLYLVLAKAIQKNEQPVSVEIVDVEKVKGRTFKITYRLSEKESPHKAKKNQLCFDMLRIYPFFQTMPLFVFEEIPN